MSSARAAALVWRLLGQALAVVAVVLVLAGTAQAQEAADLGEPFTTWQQTAQAAEGLLGRPNTPVDTLQQLRDRLSGQRDQMSAMTDTESVEVRTLRAQIEALGPPPAEGQTESSEVAQRRESLTSQLATAMAPSLAARQAYERANVIISELDTMIRRANARALLARSPSPFDPDAWIQAGTEISSWRDSVATGIDRALADADRAARFWASLPLAVLLALFGLAVIFVGEPWAAHRAGRAAAAADSAARRRVITLAGFVARLLLPLVGAAALMVVPPLVDLQIGAAQSLRSALPAMVLFVVVAHVLGRAIFTGGYGESVHGIGPSFTSRTAYVLSLALGVFLAVELALGSIQSDFSFSTRAATVFAAPVIIVGAALLLVFGGVLGRLVRAGDKEPEADGETVHPVGGAWMLVARLVQLSAALAIVMVPLGYVNLARESLVPVILSMALVGVAFWLFELLVGLAAELAATPGADEHEEPTLVPVLLAFLIGVAVLPPLALVWGARVSDIAEVWRIVTDGVPIGETRVSLSVVLTLAVVLAVGVLITRWLQRLLDRTVLPRTRLDVGVRTALVTGLGYVGLTLSALVAISTAGIDLSSLAFIAGALSVGIGFGLQNIVQNFVSGIILLIERPIKEGDWIEVNGHEGLVRRISVRSTRIETFDRHDVIVPNGDLISGAVRNMTLSSRIGRVIIPVGVAYGSDLEATRKVLADAAAENAGVLKYPEPLVLFRGLGDSSLDFELRCYLRDISTTLKLRSELMFAIYDGLNASGVEIPFPQRDIHIRSQPSAAAGVEA